MRTERPEGKFSLNWQLNPLSPVCSNASSMVMAPWGQIKSPTLGQVFSCHSWNIWTGPEERIALSLPTAMVYLLVPCGG